MKKLVIVNPRRFFSFLFVIALLSGLLTFGFFKALSSETAYGASEKIKSEERLDKENQTRTIYVKKGESLWSIAEPLAQEYKMDPRDMIRKIIELNNLEAMTLHPGQPLQLPVI